MKLLKTMGLTTLLTTLMCSTMAFAESPRRLCPSPWKSAVTNSDDCGLQDFSIASTFGFTNVKRLVTAKIRSGYLAESSLVPFRGNVIYYQGLGDSMLNHQPLFTRLTAAGYRVIAFDYMGQGGSSGTMNDTRIAEIGLLGNKIWQLHARDLHLSPKQNIIGWSTGGLAAYVQSHLEKEEKNIVLIAPGIVPRMKVGEQNLLAFKFNQITLSTLTNESYDNGLLNPHVDPIKPNSPLDILDFAWNITFTAKLYRHVSIRRKINGLVMLSGEQDTYVNGEKTKRVLRKKAAHFEVEEYPNTLHEIDNEAEPMRSKAHQDILNFLNKHN